MHCFFDSILRRLRAAALGGLAIACLVPATVLAASEGDQEDKTESPYFAVSSDDPGVDALPLKRTDVDVRILGVIADVTVRQRYRNAGTRAIEARYVFPGSTRAAVYGMTVRLGDRVLTAKIKEKAQAKVEYQEAKDAGKTAALLEQQRPNVFEMNVANILPGDEVDVELRYTELIVPTDGVYQFVFPTVVGPRYNGGAGAESHKAEGWISTPYLKSGQGSTSGFSMRVRVTTPTGVKDVWSPSHRVVVKKVGEREVEVVVGGGAGVSAGATTPAPSAPPLLEEEGKSGAGNNRDFVLDYRLAGDTIQTGMLLSRGEKENFFLAMVEPPKSVAPAAIVPREYVFIVDISGSMDGFPLDTAKLLIRELVGGLRPADTFNLLLFAGDNTVLSPTSISATKPNIERALHTLSHYRGGGGTELLPALRRALSMPAEADRARTFVVITDGYVSVEREAFDLVATNLDKANLFAFGIGSGVNRYLIEGLARAGQGEPFVVLGPDMASREARRFMQMIEAPVLTRVKAHFEGLDVYDVEPIALPDVFAQRPVILFGKWRGAPAGKLILEGRAANGPYRTEIIVTPEQAREENAALRYLWARHRIASLTDQEHLEGGEDYRQAILDLGLEYNLLTQYTSFIAVDEVVRNLKPGDAASVKQPLPLPEGVSELAVYAQVASTPEPSTWAMLGIALTGLGVVAMRRVRSGRNSTATRAGVE